MDYAKYYASKLTNLFYAAQQAPTTEPKSIDLEYMALSQKYNFPLSTKQPTTDSNQNN